MERIERLVSEGKKRTVLFEFKRIMEEERRPDFMLQRKVVAVCARKYKQFRVPPSTNLFRSASMTSSP